ncbi:TPA: hypothetical protein ACGMOQ_001231 [Streptococcus agalactiae]|nr:hypothetical protein [Streptococcus agalactiae]
MGTLAINYIGILLEIDISDQQKKEGKFLLKTYHSELDDPTLTIPYNQIAEFVYQNTESNESNEILNHNIKTLLSTYEGKNYDTLAQNLEKIRNNYTLSQIQKEFILKNSQEAKDVLKEIAPELKTLAKATSKLSATNDELKKQSAEAEDVLKKVKQEVDDVRNTKSSIYTDFIAILGVFSAFVFVMFGGIDVARAIFDIGNDLQTLDLSRMITISSLMLIGVLTIMYSLLFWIARITGKNLGDCHSPKCVNGCNTKYHFFTRHSFYFFLMLLLVIIAASSHYWFK